MQTIADIKNVVGRVRCPPFEFHAADEHGVPMVRVYNPHGVCTVTDAALPWHGRWWRLSYHMTDGEIVQTLLKAVLTACEHEVRETFSYRGVTVFDPHYDIEKLVALRSSPGALKERE